MERYRIVWITFNAFIDTDYYIVKELMKYYDIEWHVIRSENDAFEYVDKMEALEGTEGINVSLHVCGKRLRKLSCAFYYYHMLSQIRKIKPDLLYTSLAGAPYFIPILSCITSTKKTILAIHNVHVPKGGSASSFFRLYNKYAISCFYNFQTFSKSQYQALKNIVPNKNVFYAPFILKDYGPPHKKRVSNKITFLNFGNIRPYKRIDVLIEAAQAAYEQLGIEFRVLIAGKCNNWDEYERMIKYPDLFDIRLGRINNDDIPDLFNESDYFVAPYQDIAQSGSSVIAINYNKPIIASKLPAFQEYIEDGKTGFLIQPADINSLKEVIEFVLHNHSVKYSEMVENIIETKNKIFSTDTIIRKYRYFFDEVIEM